MATPLSRDRRAPRADAGLAPSPALPASATEKAAILVVDDLPEKLMVYEAVLEELGQDIVAVRSGDEALRRLLKQEFAVILLDVNMPGMDGFETAELIRRRRQSAHTPIIFITAYADEMHTAQGYSLGAVDYIPAPVVPEVLRAKVRVFVELYAMRQRVKRQAEERIALAREQIARAAAEAETRRSNFLAEASRVLASSLDFAATARGLSQLAVPFLADVSALSVPEESGPRVIALAWRDGETATPAAFCALPEGPLAQAVDRVHASGTAETMADPPDGILAPPAPGTPGPGAFTVLPLRARGRTLGVWALGLCGREKRFGAAELALARDLSDRAAIAIDNVLLLAREQAARAELTEQAKELLRLNAELESSNRELDAFASIASHDLKEPLRGIHNFAHFLLEDYGERLDGDAAGKLRVMARLAERMQALLDSLLHYSRVGRQELALREVELQTVVEDTLELLQARIQETGTEVRIPRPLPAAVVDHSRVGEVFSNLIANAIKYNDKSSRWVELGWRPGEGTHAGHAPPVYYVKDNGIGIATQHHDAVFRIFRRLHGRDEYGGGVGVGLTIVRKIVERHGGRIWLESTPGEGTTFYFTLAPGP
ncbi:histidine kinase [Sulfurifustis variabilis]|uniref:histidine kinase n=1 Tax=Sulfurifustis variabilis TaxID=1675686 RepID=A0A1B4VCD4_9GAMM|nr:response regulator [Sulfurifustis variabilis]BAU49081.1 histidine kinase [Sulfurifustis variabilis]